MKRFVLPCTAAAMLLAAAGCSGSAGSVSSPGRVSYLANGKSEVAFIRWRTVRAGQVRGTLMTDTIGGAPPSASVLVTSVPFTGAVHGTSVSLTFSRVLFLHGDAEGRLTGSGLTLAVPDADGTSQHTTFTQASRSGYARAVAALSSTAAHENLLAARAGSGPSANSRAQQRTTQLDLAALYQASSLAPRGKLAADVESFARDAATARARLAAEKQNASGDNHYCAATATVVGDSRGVSGAVLAVTGASESLTADLTAIRMDIHTADADLRRLSRAGLPAPASAPALIATADTSMAQAIASANSYIDQVNAIGNQARLLANRMATGTCSGAGQAPVTAPVAHVK